MTEVERVVHPPGGAPGVGDRGDPDLGAQRGDQALPGDRVEEPADGDPTGGDSGLQEVVVGGLPVGGIGRVGVDPVRPGRGELLEVFGPEPGLGEQEGFPTVGVGEHHPHRLGPKAGPGQDPGMPDRHSPRPQRRGGQRQVPAQGAGGLQVSARRGSGGALDPGQPGGRRPGAVQPPHPGLRDHRHRREPYRHQLVQGGGEDPEQGDTLMPGQLGEVPAGEPGDRLGDHDSVVHDRACHRETTSLVRTTRTDEAILPAATDSRQGRNPYCGEENAPISPTDRGTIHA